MVMKLDFLTDGPDGLPLVRLYQFDFQDIANLFAGLSALASGASEKVEVHALAKVEAVDGAKLLFLLGTKDEGMVCLPGGTSFECVLTPESWGTVAGLVEPFRNENIGFQWLVEIGDAKLLLSVDGQW